MKRSSVFARWWLVLILAVLGMWGLGSSSSAGTISIVDIPATGSDTNVINPGKIYTHALSFGASEGTLTINGVTFTRVVAASGTGYTFTNAGTFTAHAGNNNTHADGNMNVLLTDMFYFTGNTDPQVLTLSGLTPGVAYRMRVYYRPWSDDATRTVTVTFNGDGADTNMVVNEDAGSSAHYLNYDFTASGTSATFSTTPASIGVNWHLYGVSMEEAVIPPPATLSIKDIPETGSDTGCEISPAKTYTHALDFGDGTGTLEINGVPFAKVNTASGTGYTFTNAGNATVFYAHAGGNTQYIHADGNMAELLKNMFLFPDGDIPHDPQVLTLNGLTPGSKYSMRVYYRPWTDNSTRNATATFNGNGKNTSLAVNEDAGAAAHYLQYDFTARGTTVTFSTIPEDASWHLYGISNELLLPPAGTVMIFH